MYVTKTVVDLNTYEHPVDLMMTQNEGFETCCLTKNSIKRRPIWLQYSCVL